MIICYKDEKGNDHITEFKDIYVDGSRVMGLYQMHEGISIGSRSKRHEKVAIKENYLICECGTNEMANDVINQMFIEMRIGGYCDLADC